MICNNFHKCIINVKFASIFTNTPMCVSTVYSVLSRVPNKYHWHITRVGFEPAILVIIEQCLIDKPITKNHLNDIEWPDGKMVLKLTT